MQLSVKVSDIPDNDSFLPRQTTVQLLGILARALPPKATASNTKSTKFVEMFRHPELFTPVTNAIFWREDLKADFLDKYKSELDKLDRYNRAPLSTALANEDFVTATKLLDAGAKIFLEDKLILEIALFSIIQRDETAAGKILAAATPAEQSWLGEYLDYLHSYAIKQPVKTAKRDVLDPPLRHFGQILETMAFFNGIPSYYGFLSPSLEILRNHLQSFNSTPTFAAIAKAFDACLNNCQYYGNLPQNAAAAGTLHQQIQANIKQNNKEPVLLFGGWAGNAVAIAFIRDTLIFSNLGTASDLQHGTLLYQINKPQNITKEFIQQFIYGLGQAADPQVILDSIGAFVDAQPFYKLRQDLKPIDNCIFVNPRLIIQGMLLVLTAYQTDNKINPKTLDGLSKTVAITYQEYLNSLSTLTAAELAQFMRNNELLPNQRLECCDLALEYINQHFQDQEAIMRCVDLKNALEFVGLQDYYRRRISNAAQQAIQDHMITEQEHSAVKVIDQEYALLGKNGPNIVPPAPTDNPKTQG